MKKNMGISKDILVGKLIVEGIGGEGTWDMCRERAKRNQLHVEVESHEEVEQLNVGWNGNKSEGKQKNDLYRPNHSP